MTTGPASRPGERRGPIYAAVVAGRITDEEKRAASLQARALAVVTTSGTLVTLLVAVARFGSSRVGNELPAASRWLVAAATVLFVVAAIGGLAANRPRPLGWPDLNQLRQLMKEVWADSAATGAEKTVALTLADTLGETEKANDKVANALDAALAAEVIAIALAGAAVVVVLLTA